jgi:hypothetical protein
MQRNFIGKKNYLISISGRASVRVSVIGLFTLTSTVNPILAEATPVSNFERGRHWVPICRFAPYRPQCFTNETFTVWAKIA